MTIRNVRRLLIGWLFVVSGVSVWAGETRYKALLIGISEYPTLPASMQLRGPRNDVAQMRSLLLERGIPPGAIRVLADGVDGVGLPTRANILGELDRLAEESHSGDYVVVYFAGHGSQQPAGADRDIVESYGPLAPILLPRDVGTWQQAPGRTDGRVRNAITDNEIRARIDRMSDSGAFVWAIFDACHAARLVRGSSDPPEQGLRRVPPETLGVPASALATGDVRAEGQARLRTPRSAVYFYAAQTTESTPEMHLPTRERDAAVHGLFTYSIVQALSGGSGMTYRQLGQSILVRYAALAVASDTTPLFAGTSLDTAVFGRPSAPVRQWRLLAEGDHMSLAAGQLAGLNEGAILAVLPDAGASDTAAIGYVRVGTANAAAAMLEPLGYAGLPAQPLARLKTGAVARLVLPAARNALVVHKDLSACSSPCAFEAALAAWGSGQTPSGGSAIVWETDAERSDLNLVAVADRLWLLPGSASRHPCVAGSSQERARCVTLLERSRPSVLAAPSAKTPELAAAIGAVLATSARALDLLRLVSQQTPGESQLEVSATIVSPQGVAAPCPDATVSPVNDGSIAQIALKDKGAVGYDVTALYIDSRYGISVLFPRSGAVNRIESGDQTQFAFRLTTRQSEGLEHLIVISTEARPHQERSDFSELGQSGLPGETVVRGTIESPGRINAKVFSWFLQP